MAPSARGRRGNADAFQRWVAKYGGPDRVATDLGVHLGTVQCWLYRQGWPKVSHIVAILDLARGALSFEDIVASTAKPGETPVAITRRQTTAKRKKGA